MLEFQSDQKAICLVTTNLWSTVLVFPPLACPRNELWLLSYHRARENIAAGYLQFNWKDQKSNPAEILSKH